MATIIKISKNLKCDDKLIPSILSEIGIDEKYRINSSIRRSDISSIEIDTKNKKIIVILSGEGSGRRNAWISQPFLNIMKYKIFDDIYIYNRGIAEPTRRNIFDIRCLKTFGVKFIGNDKLGDKLISELTRFSDFDDFINDYNLIKEISDKKHNNITNIEHRNDFIEIINGRTDGACRGSLFMSILGLKNLSNKIKVFAKKDHDLGKVFMNFMKTSLNVDFEISENEIQKLISMTDKKENTGRLFQGRCTRNASIRVGNENCEITGDENMVITSHIIPVNYCEFLLRSKKIKKELCIDLCESGNNALRLMHAIDKLFNDGYITFDNNGDVILSEKISSINKMIVGFIKNKIIINDKIRTSLYFHRKYIFLDNKNDITNITNITNEELEMLKNII